MKTLHVELPDQLAQQMEDLVQAGWFSSEGDVTRQALTDFVRRQWLALQEQFQRDDIRWALSAKEATR